MTKQITFTSDHFGVGELPAELVIDVYLTAYNEDEGEFDIESIYNPLTKEFIELDEFPSDERSKLENRCQELADENAYENYIDRMIDKAENLADSAREGD